MRMGKLLALEYTPERRNRRTPTKEIIHLYDGQKLQKTARSYLVSTHQRRRYAVSALLQQSTPADPAILACHFGSP